MSEDKRPLVQASDILAKIEKGEDVQYDGYVIEGNLDICDIKLQEEDGKQVINSNISIKNSRFDGFVKFTNVIFKKGINFSDTIFNGNWRGISADFSSAILGDANLMSNFNFLDAYITESPFSGVHFRGATFSGFTNFFDATFSGFANFFDATFSGYADFRSATFSGRADFRSATFSDKANFESAAFSGRASFSSATFSDDANSFGATFSDDADFESAIFSGYANFDSAIFSGYADFRRATFNYANFDGSIFEGDALTFKNAIFYKPSPQEDACRRAKMVLERAGDREGADYHFYREMEAKREQKGLDYEYFDYEILLFDRNIQLPDQELTSVPKYLWHNLLEYFFMQVVFGYGVHPFRLMFFWLLMVFLFASIFGAINALEKANWKDYIWLSISTAVTPGYAGYKFEPGSNYQLIAGIEAILGTFMWAAFITTFAKKFMR